MSTQPNDGGPAFPRADDVANSNAGMSLRDWFAGQALAGILAKGDYYTEDAAKSAYFAADSMIAARGQA